MTSNDRVSLADLLREQDPLGMAASGAAVHSVALINNLYLNGGLTRDQLATKIGVSRNRVDEVLDGDGNIRVSTLARFLKAYGYSLTIEAEKDHT